MWILRLTLALVFVSLANAVNAAQEFYGRSGNAIEIDFGELPGIPANATFSSLSLGGFSGHTVLTSSDLGQGSFSSDGRLWVFPNPARDTAPTGDINLDERGFQGRLDGSVRINGVTIDFAVNVRPGYTGVGAGSVGQSGERINRSANNELFVAQQQHRLSYFGFVQEGGGQLVIDGDFGPNTDAAMSTFQAAFLAGVNTTQAGVDGIVGPNTASWLNAANAPTWEELIDPDPQVPGSFSVNSMIGDFDILPGRDSGTGLRTGLTPQSERFGTSWALDLWRAGSAGAKAETGVTQLMNGMSTDDGYGSSAFHSTHRSGMDIDLHVDGATQNFGNGFISSTEQDLIDIAVEYLDAGSSGGSQRGAVLRIISSNQDVLNGIATERPGTSTLFDSSGGHLNHLHLDVDSPAQVAGQADLPGDFDFDDQVSAFDFLVWQRGSSPNPLSATDLSAWQTNFGTGVPVAAILATVPEPSTSIVLVLGICMFATLRGNR